MQRQLYRRRLVPIAFLICVLALLLVASAGQEEFLLAHSQIRDSATLVCVVSRSDSENSEGNMDAVVLVEEGKLRQPYPEDNEAAQRKFATQYFSRGKRYHVTFGGGEVGTATVKSFDKGCNNIHATALVEDNGRIPAKLPALAASSDSLGQKPSSRRPPTSVERETVMKLVTQIYRSRATTPALLLTLKTTNLTATDLDGDGKFELIGSFVIETKAKARKDLLLIAEPDGASFKPALVNFQAYKLPAEGFDSAVDFLDQLDLDGDGTGEVFVRQNGFDAYGYAIYKKQDGSWREIFKAIGDAC